MRGRGLDPAAARHDVHDAQRPRSVSTGASAASGSRPMDAVRQATPRTCRTRLRTPRFTARSSRLLRRAGSNAPPRTGAALGRPRGDRTPPPARPDDRRPARLLTNPDTRAGYEGIGPGASSSYPRGSRRRGQARTAAEVVAACAASASLLVPQGGDTGAGAAGSAPSRGRSSQPAAPAPSRRPSTRLLRRRGGGRRHRPGRAGRPPGRRGCASASIWRPATAPRSAGWSPRTPGDCASSATVGMRQQVARDRGRARWRLDRLPPRRSCRRTTSATTWPGSCPAARAPSGSSPAPGCA